MYYGIKKVNFSPGLIMEYCEIKMTMYNGGIVHEDINC